MLMAAAAAVPLVVLLNPTWLERIPPPPGKPLLTILVDRSASMATRDAGSGQTRYRAGVACAAAAARELKATVRGSPPHVRQNSAPASLETLAEGAGRRGDRSGRRRARRLAKTTGRRARRCCC